MFSKYVLHLKIKCANNVTMNRFFKVCGNQFHIKSYFFKSQMKLKKTFPNEMFQIFEKQDILSYNFFSTLPTVGHCVWR